jgi:hypothetical protein
MLSPTSPFLSDHWVTVRETGNAPGGMDAKSVDLCFAGVVELGYLPLPCLHAGLSPMRLAGEQIQHFLNFDVGRKVFQARFQ